MQLVPVDAQLSPRRTKQPIGYRVLDINREVVTPFTKTRVGESRIPGCYFVAGGVEAPDDGGFIVWGLKDKDIAEAPIEPVAADYSEQLAALADALQSTIDLQLGSLHTGLDQLREQTDASAATLAQVAEMDRAQKLMVELRTLLDASIVGASTPNIVQETAAAEVTRERQKLASDRQRMATVLDDFLAKVGVPHE